MKTRTSLGIMIACGLLMGLPLAACGGGDENPDGTEGTGQDGKGGAGDTDGGKEDDDKSQSGLDDGEQGIFAILNGVPLKANHPDRFGGYLQKKSLDDSRGFSHAIADAYEVIEGETVEWSMWIPRVPGSYRCDQKVGDELLGSVMIGKGPNGRGAAGTGAGVSNCVFEVTRFDAAGIISGTFSGTFGGFLGAPQDVKQGSFYFDLTP